MHVLNVMLSFSYNEERRIVYVGNYFLWHNRGAIHAIILPCVKPDPSPILVESNHLTWCSHNVCSHLDVFFLRQIGFDVVGVVYFSVLPHAPCGSMNCYPSQIVVKVIRDKAIRGVTEIDFVIPIFRFPKLNHRCLISRIYLKKYDLKNRYAGKIYLHASTMLNGCPLFVATRSRSISKLSQFFEQVMIIVYRRKT